MSILIKGMEMPQGCGDCPCLGGEYHGSYGNHFYCQVTDKGIGEHKPDWCPIIEVPEDVQPLKYGEWTAEGNDEYGNYWDECTVCRRAVFFPPSVKNDYKYCPHCGARMGDEDDV